MLVEFAVENFRSFKDMQRLQMEAANITSKNKDLDKQNVFKAKNLNLLKFKAIYGANGSGKSNLVNAMATMWQIIKNSFKNDGILDEYIRAFRLDEVSSKAPSFFQIVFIHEDIQYRYGFEADRERIHSEWLFVKKRKEVPYFLREDNEIIDYNESSFSEIKAILKNKHNNALFRKNSLVLSVLAILNGNLATLISQTIYKKITIFYDMEIPRTEAFLAYILSKDEPYKRRVLSFLQSIDDTILGIDIDKENQFLIQRNRLDKNNVPQLVNFHLENEEAEGTKKVFYLTPMLLKLLQLGGTLILDEFDARLHPLLSEKIVSLFNSKETNPNNAQLVVVTHNTNLMSANLLRRDQILFVSKNRKGESSIVDLVEFKGIRNTTSYEKDYLMGKYGALPYLNKIEQIFNQ